jgi:hypothetical protein
MRLLAREGDLELAPALLGLPTTHVIDHQPTHRARRVAEEARMVGELSVAARNAEICLMNQRGGAERKLAPATPQIVLGNLVQFPVEHGEQILGPEGVDRHDVAHRLRINRQDDRLVELGTANL